MVCGAPGAIGGEGGAGIDPVGGAGGAGGAGGIGTLNGSAFGMAMIIPLFTQAEDVQSGKRVADAKIDKIFADWVEPARTTVATADR